MPRRRIERIAHNESVFRSLNESLEASLHRGRPDSDRIGFICECGNPRCDETVLVELPAYESVRADSQLFIVLPGHEMSEAEDVVSDHGDYVVVRKHADAAKLVERSDPRT